MNVLIRRGTESDVEEVEKLLLAAGVKHDHLASGMANFWLAVEKETEEIIGTLSVETYGESALLRSLVLIKRLAQQTEGKQLLRRLLAQAEQSGARELYLFTPLPHLFIHMGFETVDFSDLPLPIQDLPYSIAQIGRTQAMRKGCVSRLPFTHYPQTPVDNVYK